MNLFGNVVYVYMYVRYVRRSLVAVGGRFHQFNQLN